MAGRKIKDESDAWTCLAAVEDSGLSRRAWARANGVDARSLHCWWLALGRRVEDAEPAPMHLVELVPAPSTLTPALMIRAGPFEVEVGTDFDDGALLRVLRVVLEC